MICSRKPSLEGIGFCLRLTSKTYLQWKPLCHSPFSPPFQFYLAMFFVIHDFMIFCQVELNPNPTTKKKQKWDGFLATICSVTRGYLKRDPEPMAASAFVRCAMLCLKMWQIWRCSLSTSWFLRHGSFGWQVVLQFAERWDNKLYIYI